MFSLAACVRKVCALSKVLDSSICDVCIAFVRHLQQNSPLFECQPALYTFGLQAALSGESRARGLFATCRPQALASWLVTKLLPALSQKLGDECRNLPLLGVASAFAAVFVRQLRRVLSNNASVPSTSFYCLRTGGNATCR